MQFIVYDFEVYEKDWIVVFKKNEERTVIVNDRSLLETYYNEHKENIFVGFNNKHYDDYILKSILSGIDPKRMSDYIILKGRQGWEFPGLKYFELNTLDMKQDVVGNLSLSLKEAEGNMGEAIEESSVPFDIDRKLTQEELNSVIEYCSIDVENTEKILTRRKDDVVVRLEILQMFNLPINNIGKTNAKLAAAILGARLRERNDELIYDFPNNLVLKTENIKGFYSQVIDYKNNLSIDICNVPHVLGYGGLHGAKQGIFEGNIWYLDVKSYYPTLMINYNYTSRNIKDSNKYKEIYDLRLQYQAQKDKREKGLKLLLNICYGAMKNKYNPLFDPKQANQVCITGQLFLIDLLEKIEPYIELLQSNTDGIIFISRNDEAIQKEVADWQARTKNNFSIKKIDKLWQKDVNNYIFKSGDYIEVKGGYVKMFKGGSFINNTTTIIDTAVVEYFINNTPVEETIYNCSDLIKFQYICKKGPTYLRVEQDGNILNNVNRVFATKNKELGNLYKVKENGRKDSIAGLPPNCIIINRKLDEVSFDEVNLDKEWYVLKAKERINDFLKKE